MLTWILKGCSRHSSLAFLRVSAVRALGIAMLIASSPAKQSAPQFPVFRDITRPAGLAYKITNGDKLSDYLIDINGEELALLTITMMGFKTFIS